MDENLAEFLRHLALEKNSSAHTVKSYREDLTQALEFFRGRLGASELRPANITTRLLRAYLAWVSESVGLNLDDVDFDGGLATVRGKGKRERLALLGGPATKALRRWLPARDELLATQGRQQAALFLNKRGSRLTSRSVGRMLEKY